MIGLLAVGNDPTIALRPDAVMGDTHQRQIRYASILREYHLITKAPPLSVPPRIQVTGNFWVYPCGRRSMASYLIDATQTGWKIVRENAVEAVSAQDPFLTGVIGYAIAQRAGLPLSLHFVADALDNPAWLGEKLVYRALNRLAHWLVPRASTYRVVSASERAKLVGLGVPIERIWNLPSITDFSRFLAANGSSLRHRWLGSRHDQVILCVARLVPQKDLHTLLRAMVRIRAQHPAALLVIAGSGPMEGTLRRLITELALEEQVLMLGGIPYDELAGHYAAADVVVLSSVYEGNARVLAEAAASARPVVSTDVSGARDTIVDGQTGFVVPIGDETAMSERVIDLLKDPDQARSMGQQARAHVLALYNPERILAGFQDLWEATARAPKPMVTP